MVEHSNLIIDKNDYYLSEKDIHLIIAKHVETVKHSLPFFKDASSFDQGKSDESGRDVFAKPRFWRLALKVNKR